MQENVDKEVDTFAGDKLGFEVVEMSAGEDVEVATNDVDMATKDGEVASKGVEEVKDKVVKEVNIKQGGMRKRNG